MHHINDLFFHLMQYVVFILSWVVWHCIFELCTEFFIWSSLGECNFLLMGHKICKMEKNRTYSMLFFIFTFSNFFSFVFYFSLLWLSRPLLKTTLYSSPESAGIKGSTVYTLINTKVYLRMFKKMKFQSNVFEIVNLAC